MSDRFDDEPEALWDEPEESLFDEPVTQQGPGLFDLPDGAGGDEPTPTIEPADEGADAADEGADAEVAPPRNVTGEPEPVDDLGDAGDSIVDSDLVEDGDLEEDAELEDALAEEPDDADEPEMGEEPEIGEEREMVDESDDADESGPQPVDGGEHDMDEVPAPPAAQPRGQRPETAPAPLALYRRYRPDTFDDVIGQEHVTEPLKRALSNNKVNHAYLFSGPRGCGKTTSARILARSLNCELGPTPTPCGTCQSCRDLARGGPGSIDVIEMDAASNGGVDDARDLRERAFFAPVQSRYKIYIIDEAHMVTSAGFNALLKLVEEPPPHVKFIFATTEPEKVIGTIRSRTHHYPFRLVPPKLLVSYLSGLCDKEGVQVDPEVLPLVVRAGEGSVRDSLSVLDQLLGAAGENGVDYATAAALLGYTPETLLDEIMDAFAARDGRGVFAAVDKVIEAGQDPRRFAEDLLRRLRDLVIIAAVSQSEEGMPAGLIDVPADQAERLTSQAAAMGRGELTRAAEVIAEGLTAMRGTTAPRLYLELMCSRVLLPGADAEGELGLHARLERLERRLAEGGVPVSRAEQSTPRPEARQEWGDTRSVPESSARTAAPRGADDAAPGHADDRGGSPARTQRPAQTSSDAPVEHGGQSHRERQGQSPAQRQREAERPLQAVPDNVVPMQRSSTRAAGPLPYQDAPQQASPERPRQGRPGDIDAARIRQEWPRVLDEVQRRRRFTWILLSQNAQVADVSDGTLTLAFNNPGARDRFGSSGSLDLLRDAIIEVLGADLRIRLGGGDGDGGPRGPQGRPQQRHHQEQHRDMPAGRGEPRDHREAAPMDDEVPPPPDEEPEPARSHREFVEAARAGVRPTTSAHDVEAPAEPTYDPTVESADDEDVDDSGADAAELVMRELGGTVIAEDET